MAIKANHVTLARIFLLPAPIAMLIYGESIAWWSAFFLLLFLGITDALDGYMARKEGPTKLGSFLDPVADKIYIAAIFVSFIGLKIFPPWILCAILFREFILTALRSCVAARNTSLKTSKLGKLKTIIQMGGCGTIFFTIVLPNFWLSLICAILSILFLLYGIYWIVKNKKQLYWPLPVFFCLLLVAFLGLLTTKEINLLVQAIIIVAFTWISALDYLIGSFKLFRTSGIRRGDLIRLLWACTYGLLVAPSVAAHPIITLPIWIIISFEFSTGGIDNIRVSEKKLLSFYPFLISSLAGILFVILLKLPFSPLFLSICLLLLSLIICTVFFVKNKDLFRKAF